MFSVHDPCVCISDIFLIFFSVLFYLDMSNVFEDHFLFLIIQGLIWQIPANPQY